MNVEKRFLYVSPDGEIMYAMWLKGELLEHQKASETDDYKVIGMYVLGFLGYQEEVEKIKKKQEKRETG